jgi:hypothetical protein
MHSSVANGFVEINVTVADLDVEATIGVGADPSLIVDRGALATEIREGDQIADIALLALGQ